MSGQRHNPRECWCGIDHGLERGIAAREAAKPGDRVELVRALDKHTRLEPGSLGTVAFVDALGTVHVKWDGGSTLGLIAGVDEWRVLAPQVSR